MADIEKQISELTNLVQSLTTEVQTLKKMIPQPKKSCEGKTAKGLPCGNKCIDGERYCRMHLNKPEPVPKPPRVPKKTKKKKIQIMMMMNLMSPLQKWRKKLNLRF